METIKKLLDRAKEKTGAKNEHQLAIAIGIPSQRIHDYYRGERIPDEYACMKIAEILEIPLDVVIANVRSESEKDETRREAWKRYAKKLVRIAASFMIAALLGLSSTTLLMTGEAKAQTQQGIQSGDIDEHITNYATFVDFWLQFWLYLVAGFLASDPTHSPQPELSPVSVDKAPRHWGVCFGGKGLKKRCL